MSALAAAILSGDSAKAQAAQLVTIERFEALEEGDDYVALKVALTSMASPASLSGLSASWRRATHPHGLHHPEPVAGGREADPGPDGDSGPFLAHAPLLEERGARQAQLLRGARRENSMKLRSSASSRGPWRISRARCTTLRSSRTLPGQSCCCSFASAAAVNFGGGPGGAL